MYNYHSLTDAQRATMDAYTAEAIAKLSDAEIEKLPTADDGHMADYKIMTRDRLVGVMRVGREDGYYGPKVFHQRLVNGRWLDCDKFGRVKGA